METVSYDEWISERHAETGKNSMKLFVAATARSVAVTHHAATLEDAQAYEAQFPKSYRVRATTLSGYEIDGRVGLNMMYVDLAETKGNSKNESGMKRLDAYLKKAEALGYEVLWVTGNRGGAQYIDTMEALKAQAL